MTAFAYMASKGRAVTKDLTRTGLRPNGRYIKSKYLVTQLSVDTIA